MEEYLKNGRICILPPNWLKLHAILEQETGGRVSAPLILSGWNLTEDWEKSMRFKEHMQLIKKQNISAARIFLDQLQEEDWYKN